MACVRPAPCGVPAITSGVRHVPISIDRLASVWPRIDGVLYPSFAGGCVLYAALVFYGSLLRQTHGAWSAPLDDVFIHFDYARATARGYPFQWSEGNGFSSGNTSLTYPFVLAAGYLAGFRGTSIMVWAAIVACLSTFGFLLGVARLAEPLGRWAKYLIPPAVLSLGALDWSLFSGMENAFHLGMWALALTAALGVVEAAERRPASVPLRGWLAGAAGALLFATRPESAVCVAALGVLAAVAVRRASGLGAGLRTLARVGLPGAVAMVAQAAANRLFTGEWAANGAIAKLGINDPYMPAHEKWNEYRFLFRYVIYRNTEHHFAETPPGTFGWGWLVPAVGLVPLLCKRTRRPRSCSGSAARLAGAGRGEPPGALAERALHHVRGRVGLRALRARPRRADEPGPRCCHRRLLGRAERVVAAARAAAAVAVAALYCRAPAPADAGSGLVLRAREQEHSRPAPRRRPPPGQAARAEGPRGRRGRAHVCLGFTWPRPHRARRLPRPPLRSGGRARPRGLARAHRANAAERAPRHDGPLSLVVGRSPRRSSASALEEVPVYGNVICGGAEKAIYRANWRALDRSGMPRAIRRGERVVDEVDVADLAERESAPLHVPAPRHGVRRFPRAR